MDNNINFLNSIYKTCEMGIIGINDVIDKVKKEKFRDLLNKQKEEYNNILKDSQKIFLDFGQKEKELGSITKVNSKIMSEMKLINKEDSYIAKMMREGTNNGITKITKAVHENKEADHEILELADKLLNLMEHSLEELKEYL